MRHLLLALLLFVCTPLHAEMRIDSIDLHQRTASELIPILQPMLDNGGSLTGTGYKLFIRSSPENIEQLRQMIAQIDVAPQQLLISVSLDRRVLDENQHAGAHVRIQGGNRPAPEGRIKYDVRMFERKQTTRAPQVQQVRVSEGLWATIRTGQAVPIATRNRNPDGTVTETYTYTAVASGFQVLPRVNGNTVTLAIRPQSQSTQARHEGAYNTTEINTTVTGKLGHWIVLGSVGTSRQHSGSGIIYHTQQHSNDTSQIYVKVDRIEK